MALIDEAPARDIIELLEVIELDYRFSGTSEENSALVRRLRSWIGPFGVECPQCGAEPAERCNYGSSDRPATFHALRHLQFVKEDTE